MDTKYIELRKRMIDNQIRTFNVNELSILDAFFSISREVFFPDELKEYAYCDIHVMLSHDRFYNLKEDRYISAPKELAKLIQCANISRKDFVLDIGINTGYSSAILSKLAESVLALESDPFLINFSTKALNDSHCDNVVIAQGPLEEGYSLQSPYDVIFISGSIDFIPKKIIFQLRENGRLIIVKRFYDGGGTAFCYVRKGDNLSIKKSFNLFMEPLPGFINLCSFVF